MDRNDFYAGARIRPNFIAGLTKDAAKYQALGITEQVMLSFTSDPYPVEHHMTTRQAITILRDYGLGFCTLTKGGTRALRDIDLFRPGRDAFASTLTTLDDSFSRQWEPGAALPNDRLAALKAFHGAGVYTWVSLEPTLNTESSEAIIRATHNFVDLYKIGRANYLPMTATTDWEAYTHRMMAVCAELGVTHYFKHDLQPFLPVGYHNPLRQAQHH
jgi:DNA repair photolyase